MRIGAVIAEYNPFHNGHAYQLAQFRRECDLDYVVVIMSGCFVQRGEPAICDKYTRARWALMGGADMVIELPVYYSLANAQDFACGAVRTMSGIADVIGFGAETDNIDLLKQAAKVDTSSCADETRGKSHPRAVHEYISKEYGDDLASVFSSPNSTLAVEYIKAVNLYAPDISVHVTERIGAAHDSHAVTEGYASASTIRSMLLSGQDVSDFIPPYVDIENRKLITAKDFDRLILHTLRSMKTDELGRIGYVREGLENLISREAFRVTSYDALLHAVKSKRYTMARLKRICMCALFGITDEMTHSAPLYIHILGVREYAKGPLLAELKKRSRLQILARGKDYKRYTDNSRALTNTDLFATNTYALFCDELPNVDLINKLLII